ncbi:MAG TPA: DUF5996 family protein [Candidatus Dormibacteraeota bacterium]|nr:DUF5996 family protein [Candidatus Dormibacteraeota bacterium]
METPRTPLRQTPSQPRHASEPWPALPLEAWTDTCETLHMWMQIVGKVKLTLSPFQNEWWQVAFHPTARGLTTGPIPSNDGVFEAEFDFVDHNLVLRTSDGRCKALALMPGSVSDFYQHVMNALSALGIELRINPVPVEVPNPIPFGADHEHTSYDPDYVYRWWLILTRTAMIMEQFRSSFVGKSSPIQFFWGSFDLTETRFSGRPAAPPQGVPRFVQLAEDQENMACGFWPGNTSASGVTLGQPAFYAYAYPEPPGFKEASVRPAAARYNEKLGQFILFYEDVRRADFRERAIIDFFESTYDAAATLARWDRQLLERRAEPVTARPPSRSTAS